MDLASLLIMLEISVILTTNAHNCQQICNNIFKNTKHLHGLDVTSPSSVRSETCRILMFLKIVL